MDKAKHTQGPWTLDTCLHIYGLGEPKPIDGFPGGVSVEEVHVCTAKTYADAALIAAAPELLAALEAVDEFAKNPDQLSRDHDGVLAQVRAAIAKATGA